MEISVVLIILCMHSTSAVSIMSELKCNVLRFGYGVNFRHEGMLLHSFDRFYLVTKIEIPKIPSTIREMFDVYCKNIIPYMYLYKHQVE